MIRFFEVFLVFSRYFIIYLLVRLKINKKPNEKILKNFFEDAGGAFIKFGQLLALRVDFLPQSFALQMLDLLDNVAPFSYDEVKNIFLEELGTTPDKIFYDFQKKPFASASFGQVHGAKISENEIVVVKVLRPGIETKVKVDLFIINIFAYFMDMLFQINTLPWRELHNELKKWTKDELDYRIEADNAQMLKNGFENDNIIVIPKIYHELTTKKILVEEYIEGVHLNRVLKGIKSGRYSEKNLLEQGINVKKMQKLISKALFKQFFVYGVFHADPHPGNIIILPNNKIAFIDFGIVGKADRKNYDMFLKFIENGINLKMDKACFYFANFASSELKQIMISAFPAQLNNEHLNEFFLMFSGYFSKKVDALITKGIDDVRNYKKDLPIVLIEIAKQANKYKIKLPTSAVMFLRMFTIKAMLTKQLDKDYLMMSNLKDFFNEYPVSELSKQNNTEYIPRINRENALEKLNNWLSLLFETEPEMYKLVHDFVSRYNFINA